MRPCASTPTTSSCWRRAFATTTPIPTRCSPRRCGCTPRWPRRRVMPRAPPRVVEPDGVIARRLGDHLPRQQLGVDPGLGQPEHRARGGEEPGVASRAAGVEGVAVVRLAPDEALAAGEIVAIGQPGL